MRPFDPGLVAGELVGERVAEVERRGKYLIVRFASGRTLLVHLRMTGSLRHAPRGGAAGRPAPTRDVLRLDNGSDVAYRDVRRFGTWELFDEGELRPYLATRLGPEPLAPRSARRGSRGSPQGDARRSSRPCSTSDDRRAREHLRRRGALARPLHPLRPAGELDADELARLHRAIRAALRKGIARQGSTLRDYARPTGRPARCRTSSTSYGRGGEPCDRCGSRSSASSSAGARHVVYCPSSVPATRYRSTRLPRRSYTRGMAPSTTTEAVVLRSFGSARPTASCTSTRGERAGSARSRRASARRRPASAARLEPFSHVELVAPPGSRRARDGHRRVARPLARPDPLRRRTGSRSG